MKPHLNGRALPDFLIIGAQKSATTSLLSYIGRHSQVRLGRKKTAHFFDLSFHKGAGWYAGHFPRIRPWPFSLFFSRTLRKELAHREILSLLYVPARSSSAGAAIAA